MNANKLMPILLGIAAVGMLAGILNPPANKVPINSLFTRIATALESYAIDHNGNYPPDEGTPPSLNGAYTLSNRLTTPVPYLAPEDLIDPFSNATFHGRIRYLNIDNTYGESMSPGKRDIYPVYKELHGSWLIWSGTGRSGTQYYWDLVPYDATNGTLSAGSTYRSQRFNSETGESTGAP